MKRMRVLGVCILALMVVAACAADVPEDIKSLDIAWSETAIDIGETAQLQMTDAVSWISSDESVATVDQSGCVTGLAKGDVVITAEADGGVRTTFTVTVK